MAVMQSGHSDMDDDILKNFFIHAPAGSIVCDAEGKIIAINRAAEEMLSVQFSPGIDANILNYFHTESRDHIRILLDMPPDASAAERHVIPLARSTGALYIRIEARTFWNSSLHKKLVFLSLIDVTREREDLFETRLSEEKYRALVNFGGDAIVVFDFDACVVEANIKALALFGYTKREFVGKHIDELYHGDLLSRHREVYNEILTNGSAMVDASYIITREQKLVPVNISGSVVEYGSLRFVQMIFRDITDQLKAEEEKNRLISELNQIFSVSAIGLCLIGMDRTILRSNSAYERFIADRKPVVGKKCYELLDGLGCGREYCRVFSSGGIAEYEYHNSRNEKESAFLISSVLYHDEKGTLVGILQSVTEITQIRKLEKEFLLIGDRERRIVSHELHDGIGQVLTGMSYLIEKLIRRMKGKNSSEMKTLCDISELARDALDKTRNIIKGLVPLFANHEAMISSIMHLVSDSKKMFDVDVLLDIDRMPRGLLQDEMTQLYYIIKESLHNSVKHGRPKTIRVHWVAENGGYQLSICDDGLREGGLPVWSDGMGLNIMRYRASLIGAHFFSGFEGNGFMVKITKKK